MKSQHISASPEKLKQLLEEYTMLGYDAEIVDDELVVRYTVAKKQKKGRRQDNEKWTKRERNFGYTRG